MGCLRKKNDEEAKKLLTGLIQKVLPDFQEEFIESFYRVGKIKRKPNNNNKPKHGINQEKEGPDSDSAQPPQHDNHEGQAHNPNTEPEPQINEQPDGKEKGKAPEQDKAGKVRPTIIGLSTTLWRECCRYQNAADIRTNSGVKGLWINRDQNNNSRRRHQLVKACYSLMLSNKIACSMRGSVITYGGKQYGYEKLNLLPEPCTPYYVKTRTTEDSKGLCFYSEHVFCSNFAPAKIKYNGIIYQTVEHAYQCT